MAEENDHTFSAPSTQPGSTVTFGGNSGSDPEPGAGGGRVTIAAPAIADRGLANDAGAPSLDEEEEFNVPNSGIDEVMSMPAPSELSGSRVQSELSGSRVSSGSQIPSGTVQEARRAFF